MRSTIFPQKNINIQVVKDEIRNTLDATVKPIIIQTMPPEGCSRVRNIYVNPQGKLIIQYGED
jgi:hypothetical protein